MSSADRPAEGSLDFIKENPVVQPAGSKAERGASSRILAEEPYRSRVAKPAQGIASISGFYPATLAARSRLA